MKSMKYITNAGAMVDTQISFAAIGILEFVSKRSAGATFTEEEILAKTPPHESRESILDALYLLKRRGYIEAVTND